MRLNATQWNGFKVAIDGPFQYLNLRSVVCFGGGPGGCGPITRSQSERKPKKRSGTTRVAYLPRSLAAIKVDCNQFSPFHVFHVPLAELFYRWNADDALFNKVPFSDFPFSRQFDGKLANLMLEMALLTLWIWLVTSLFDENPKNLRESQRIFTTEM